MQSWQKSLLLTVRLSGHLAYMVLIPLAVFGGLGLLVDRQLDTLPLFLLIGIGIAFMATLYWMKTRLREIITATSDESNRKTS